MAPPSMDLTGRVAIVTGGSRGIGRAVCLELARHGAAVAVCYQHNAVAAEQVVEQIKQIQRASSTFEQAMAVQGDVSIESDVKGIFDKAMEAFGRVHIVVHMAGQLISSYPYVEKMKVEEWERIMGVNGKGTFLVVREGMRRIEGEGGKGRIITASSTMHQILLPGYGAYAASKGAVEALTRIAAKEMKGRQVTVNCVSPGAVATDMLFADKDEAKVERFKQASLLCRLGLPEDIAAVVLFLVSDAGQWINGQVIQANGGLAL